jgi:hypothetical protein
MCCPVSSLQEPVTGAPVADNHTLASQDPACNFRHCPREMKSYPCLIRKNVAGSHLAGIYVKEVIVFECGSSLCASGSQLNVSDGGLCSRRYSLHRSEHDARSTEGLHRVRGAAVVDHCALWIEAHTCATFTMILQQRIADRGKEACEQTHDIRMQSARDAAATHRSAYRGGLQTYGSELVIADCVIVAGKPRQQVCYILCVWDVAAACALHVFPNAVTMYCIQFLT